MQESLPPELGIPLAIILWGILLFTWFRKPVAAKLDEYFAIRRHKRREKIRLRNLEVLRKQADLGVISVNEAHIAAGYPVTQIRPRHLAGR